MKRGDKKGLLRGNDIEVLQQQGSMNNVTGPS